MKWNFEKIVGLHSTKEGSQTPLAKFEKASFALGKKYGRRNIDANDLLSPIVAACEISLRALEDSSNALMTLNRKTQDEREHNLDDLKAQRASLVTPVGGAPTASTDDARVARGLSEAKRNDDKTLGSEPWDRLQEYRINKRRMEEQRNWDEVIQSFDQRKRTIETEISTTNSSIESLVTEAHSIEAEYRAAFMKIQKIYEIYWEKVKEGFDAGRSKVSNAKRFGLTKKSEEKAKARLLERTSVLKPDRKFPYVEAWPLANLPTDGNQR